MGNKRRKDGDGMRKGMLHWVSVVVLWMSTTHTFMLSNIDKSSLSELN